MEDVILKPNTDRNVASRYQRERAQSRPFHRKIEHCACARGNGDIIMMATTNWGRFCLRPRRRYRALSCTSSTLTRSITIDVIISAPEPAASQPRLPPRPHPIVDQVVRASHAGEFGADRIYAGQAAVLGNSSVGPIIQVNCWKHVIVQALQRVQLHALGLLSASVFGRLMSLTVMHSPPL